MKIIHLLLGKGNPDRMNGVNKIVHNIVMNQKQEGHDVAMWGITPTPYAPTTKRPYATQFFPSKKVNKISLSGTLLKALRELPKSTVFHIHGAFIPEFYLVAKALKKRGIDYIFTPHGPYNEQAMAKNRWVKNFYFTLFESYLLKNAKAIQLSGKSEKQSLDKMIKLYRNVYIIPNGQNREEIKFQYVPLNKTAPVFGYCGRLSTYHKGLDLMIDGFSEYKKNGGQGKLWLIGDGKDRPELEQRVADHQLSSSVNFFGTLYGQDKLNTIANMDVFLHTSRFEGMPTAVMEATSLGKPCVVTERTNVEDYVDHYQAGVSIRPNTANNIAKALSVMETNHRDGTINTMASNALALAREEFDWQKIASRLVTIYES